jgi:hypothetical protein
MVPLAANELEQATLREWKKQMPNAMGHPPWEVISGRATYAALVCREPGSEGGDAWLAKSLSRSVEQPVYSLWFDPDRLEIWVYELGKQTGSRSEDPREFAENLKVPLPTRPTRIVETYSIAVVEGASPNEVTMALGEMATESWLCVKQGSAGVLVYSTDGDIGLLGWDLAIALPQASVYLLMREPQSERFAVYILHGNTQIGVLEIPQQDIVDVPSLACVKGARTPETIATVLGIPLAWIGL